MTTPADELMEWHRQAKKRDDAYLALGPIDYTEPEYIDRAPRDRITTAELAMADAFLAPAGGLAALIEWAETDPTVISPVMIGPHEADYMYSPDDPDHLAPPADLCFTCSDFEGGRWVPIGFCHMINVDEYDPMVRPITYVAKTGRPS